MTIKLTESAKQRVYETLPSHMHEAVIGYFEEGLPPGSFLRAVLANDFMNAVGHADHINEKCLKAYAVFLYNDVPGRFYADGDVVNCAWGSYEAVDKWIEDAYEERMNHERELRNAQATEQVDG